MNAVSGYTLLLPVPGDLPVFLELALAVCKLQNPGSRVETLVIPDRPTPATRALVEANRPDWEGPLKYLPLPILDRVLLPRLNDPGKNHAAQLIRGINRSRATSILLHDADLFLMDNRVLEQEYRSLETSGLSVAGVSPAWDSWFAEHDRNLVATWELCGSVDWFRSFPPYRHVAHDAFVDGELHTFDTTFWPQFHTPAGRLAVLPGLENRVVHFNYTISTYRAYQQSRAPFLDSGFRILLIRLFVELFARTEHDYGLPDLDELSSGLGCSKGVRVHYASDQVDTFFQMRRQLDAVVSGPWSSPQAATRCQHLLADFDRFYGTTD